MAQVKFRLVAAFLSIMLCGAFGAFAFDATQVRHEAEQQAAWDASDWEAPPFQVALAADALIGHGALVLPATGYPACTDTGGGFCISATGWQLANPIAESLNVNAASWTLTDQATATGGIFASGATTNDIVGWAFTCAGCTASAAQKNGGVISIAQPAGSNANLLAILDGGTSCIAAAQCTAQLTTTAAGAMRLSVDTAASTTGFTYAQGNATGNDVNGTCTGATSEFVIAKDNNSNMTIKCNGNGTLQGGWTISGSPPLTFNDGGTSCTGAVQCTGTWTTAASGLNTILANTAASTDQVDINGGVSPGTCTTTSFILGFFNNSVARGGWTCDGIVQEDPSINSIRTPLPAIPAESSATGTAAGTTIHCVIASAGSIAASGNATITLSNNAVFTSGTSYEVSVSISDSTGTQAQRVAPVVSTQAATTFVIANNDATNAHTIIYKACGT